MPHKVKSHSWLNGILHFTEHVFGTVEEALGFAHKQGQAHSVKVYDENDQVTHEITPQNTNTYA